MEKELTKRQIFLQGFKAGIPVVFGYLPVGMAFGIMAREAGFSVLQATICSLTVFTGAGQMMAAGMVKQGATMLAIWIATFIMNLRYAIMTICCNQKTMTKHPWLKWLMAFGMTDENFAIYTSRKHKDYPIFFLGMIAMDWPSWVLGGLIGALVSDVLPTVVTLSFGVALYAMFIGLIVPSFKGNWKLALLCVITALLNTFLVFVCNLQTAWALIISTLVCAFIGVFLVDLKEDEVEENASPEVANNDKEEIKEDDSKEDSNGK